MVTFFLFVALFTALLIAELMIVTRQIKIGPGPLEESTAGNTER